MNTIKLFLVSSGFLGCSPFAPGTVGTLGGVAIAWALAGSDNFLLWTLVAAVVVYLIGRSLGDWAEQYAGKKDPGIFVLDEVVGYLVTVAWLEGPSYLTLAVAFFVFRFFEALSRREQQIQIVMGWGVFRVEVDRSAKRTLGFLQPVVLYELHSQIVTGCAVVRP